MDNGKCPSCGTSIVGSMVVSLIIGGLIGYYIGLSRTGETDATAAGLFNGEEGASVVPETNPFAKPRTNPFSSQGGAVINPFRALSEDKVN